LFRGQLHGEAEERNRARPPCLRFVASGAFAPSGCGTRSLRSLRQSSPAPRTPRSPLDRCQLRLRLIDPNLEIRP